MDIQAYISSGILESYVLGITSATENAEVEQAITKHPAIRAEVLALQETLHDYAQSQAQEPPAALKEQILKKLYQENLIDRETKIVPLKKINEESFFQKNTWLAAAAMAGLVMSIGLNAWQLTDRKALQGDVAKLISEKATLADNNVNLSSHLSTINNPAFAKVELRGTPDAPKATAVVFWNKTDESLYLSKALLPNITPSQQFQLWAIVDGKPVDAGTFDITDKFLKMNNIASNAVAFAISLEDRSNPASTATGPKGKVLAMGGVPTGKS